jgi:outer membrane protein assembly factor BamA
LSGVYNFRFRNEPPKSNPSQIQFTLGYTLNKQIIFTLPFELYASDNKYKFKGELGYFRYFYNFYGIGPKSRIEDKESYEVHFPRFRADALRHLGKSFVGLRYRYDRFDIKSIKTGGILDTQNITGKSGGNISGIGLVLQYDSRDYLYNATKGFFIDGEYFINDKWTGSDYKYTRITIEATHYTKLKDKHTFVSNFIIRAINGDPIFYDLTYFGTPRFMRGYQDRRYMDKCETILQGEYRFPIWKRFEGVAFASIGNVSSRLDYIFDTPLKIAYGAGIRYVLNRADRVRLRLDYGLTPNEGGAFYITINDAF